MRVGSLQLWTWMLWLGGCAWILISGAAVAASMATRPPDLGLHDAYYVIAHVRYTISLAAIFLIFAAIYFAFDRIRFAYSATLAALHFWGTAIGVTVTFYPQFLLGMSAEPARRMADPSQAFERLNLVSSAGAFIT